MMYILLDSVNFYFCTKFHSAMATPPLDPTMVFSIVITIVGSSGYDIISNSVCGWILARPGVNMVGHYAFHRGYEGGNSVILRL